MRVAGRARKKKPGRYFLGDFGPGNYTHIYAVQPKDGGNIKFGQALNVQRRLSGIQTGSPVRLALLGSVYLPWEVEVEIHEYLRDYKSHGEWFYPDAPVIRVADLIATKEPKELLIEIGMWKLVPNRDREQRNFEERIKD